MEDHEADRDGGAGHHEQTLADVAEHEVEPRRRKQEQEHGLAQDPAEDVDDTPGALLVEGIRSILNEAALRFGLIETDEAGPHSRGRPRAVVAEACAGSAIFVPLSSNDPRTCRATGSTRTWESYGRTEAPMRAMVLEAARTPLVPREGPDPIPGPGQIRVRVEACAVCRTDLHVVDGDLPDPKLPLVPGHEIVGIVETIGEGRDDVSVGDRVGVPWLAHTCGTAPIAHPDRKTSAMRRSSPATRRDGGFATHMVADAAYAFKLDSFPDPVATAPLMCAGLIGWRSLVAAGPGTHHRDLRVRGSRPHHRAGLPMAGAPGLRLYAAGRRSGAGLRALARGGLGRRIGRSPT